MCAFLSSVAIRALRPLSVTPLVAALMVLGVTDTALAQTASQITPDNFAPEKRRLSGAVVFSGARGTKAPEGAGNLLISLSDLKLEGALPQMAQVNADTRARLTGKTITVAEIFNAASDLETAYAQAGFVLARVVLPAQQLRDGGRLRIVVVDGFIEKIDTSAAPDAVRERLVLLTDPLVGRRGLRLPELERQLLLAGDTYGVALGSALSAGVAPGAATLILQPEFKPVTGFFAFDNSVASNLGPLTLSAGIELNSPFKLGETFYARISGAPSGDNANGLGGLLSDDPRLRTLSLGAVFPLGGDGLTLNLEATNSQSAPDILSPATTSDFQRYSLRLFYPFVRTRSRNISGQLSLDRQSDEQTLVAAGGAGRSTIYRDETTVLRAAVDGFWQPKETTAIEAGAVLSQGLGILGAGGRGAAPLSRQGADSKFTKLVVSGRLRHKLSDRFNVSLSGRMQTSFGDALITGEQFGIAGPQELSGFDAGNIKGDSGFVLRGELSAPRPARIGGYPMVISPYVFAAYGEVNLERPTATEQAQTQASSFGVGVEFNAFENERFSSATLRIEYGKGYRDDNLPDDDRFSIVGSFRF